MKGLLMLAGPAGSGKSTVEQIIRDYALSSRPFEFEAVSMAAPIKHFAKDVFLFDNATLYGPSGKRNVPDPRWSSRSYWEDCRYRVSEIFGPELLGKLCEVSPYPRDRSPNRALAYWFDGFYKRALLERGFTCREVLQTFGTEFARKHFGEDVWHRLAVLKLQASVPNGLAVIPDGRFENEIALTQAAGGKVMRLTGGASRDPGPNAHESERWIFNAPDSKLFDVTIENEITTVDDRGIEDLERKVRCALTVLFSKPPEAEVSP